MNNGGISTSLGCGISTSLGCGISTTVSIGISSTVSCGISTTISYGISGTISCGISTTVSFESISICKIGSSRIFHAYSRISITRGVSAIRWICAICGISTTAWISASLDNVLLEV